MNGPYHIHHNESEERFELSLEGHTAFAEFAVRGERLYLTHTEVPPALQGRGLAGHLAEHALAFVRQQGLHIVPLCPYMAGYIAKHPEYRELLAPGFDLDEHLKRVSG